MSQSSISSAIKSLEKEFNLTLIKRLRTGFVLTEAGEEFLKLCDGLLEHSDSVADIMSEFTNRHKTIHLGVPPMTGAVILPNLLSYFQKEYPEIKLSITEEGGIELVKKLSEGVLDFILTPNVEALDTTKFTAREFAVFEEVCCVSTQNALANKQHLDVSDLKDLPFVIFSDSFYHHGIIQQLFSSSGFTPNVIHQTTQLSTMEQLIAKNVAAGILFKERVQQLEDVRWIALSPKINTRICLVWRKDMYLTKDMEVLLTYCRQK